MPSVGTFTARVQKVGINPYVDVPADIGRTLTQAEDRRVLVRLASAEPHASRSPPTAAGDRERLVRIERMTRDGWFRTTIVPVRGVAHRLFLDMWMRRSAGLVVGDRVHITLRPDRRPRDLPVPAALVGSLAKDPQARRAWEQLPPSRRREVLAYLNFLKSNEAMARTIRKVLSELRAETQPVGATSSKKIRGGKPSGVRSRKG